MNREDLVRIGLSFDGAYQDAPFHDQNWQLVRYKPNKKAFLWTYGQVAMMAGNEKMSRAVGNALHKNPDPGLIPCYRVVNSKGQLSGEFAFGGAGAQQKLLEADGIEVVDSRVDLSKYGMKLS